jgi:CheY-like chemotaxis protein
MHLHPSRIDPDIGRILLVDAAPDERAMYAVALRVRGYDVTESADGEQALAETRMAAPDLIVSDVVLPKVDGLRFLAAVRADTATRDIPFIMLTGYEQPLNVIMDAKAAGATSVRIKPCLPETLVNDIDAVLSRARAVRAKAEAVRRRSEKMLAKSAAVLARAVESAVRPCPTCGAILKPSGVVRVSVGHTYYRPCPTGCGWWYFDGPARQLRKLM